MNPFIEREIALRTERWNALIPKCARYIEEIAGRGFRYLHPTKGWRFVSNKRLGINDKTR